MSKTTSGPTSLSNGLPLALLLGIVLLLLSYLRLAGYLNTAAFQMPRLVAQTLSEPLWQTRLGFNIMLFGLVQLMLHLLFGAGAWLLAVASERAWPTARPTRPQWILIWFLTTTAWLLVANASHFPRSSLGEPYKELGNTDLFGITPYALLTTFVAAGVIATFLVALFRALGPRRLAMLVTGTAALLVATGFLTRERAPSPATSALPNIILLGIDSLRPDMTSASETPYMHDFLDQSVQFEDAITPLARTFPSWVSILTGRHPHTTGAFMNLLPPELIRTGRTLPDLLRERGYHTVYAIDEVRFSNVDTSYGFDRAVTPTIGGSDFVLTWFSDTPLSNVLMNTRVGAVLFPFQHANRAAFVSYEPDSFVRQVDRALDSTQPLFLALHLTLPHWPFEWADSELPPDDQFGMRWKYLNSIQRADRQFGDLLAVLDRKRLLDNAIVVALSDHGEAFGAEDGFLAAGLADEDPSVIEPQQIGHGTSVFSPPQYRTVLGFRGYGGGAGRLPSPRRVAEPVSLTDIAPTIVDMLQMHRGEIFDGESLLPLMLGDTAARARFANRIRFTESEYNPNGFDFRKMTASAVAHAAMVYQVDPDSDRLEVRRNMIDVILSTRQYAALLGDSLAAAVPSDRAEGMYRLVCLPLREPATPALPGKEDHARLRQALEERFAVRFKDPEADCQSPAPQAGSGAANAGRFRGE